VANAVEL
jgi:hypothetical protein